jgi:hypothetical protein
VTKAFIWYKKGEEFKFQEDWFEFSFSVSEKVKRPNMKRFTPPRKLAGGQSDSEESDYSDSEYSYSDSYS